MPRGSKAKYTDKQKREAEHIEEDYRKKGMSAKEAEQRAWATVNEMTGRGKKGGAAAAARIGREAFRVPRWAARTCVRRSS